MKKILITLLILVFIIIISGCGKQNIANTNVNINTNTSVNTSTSTNISDVSKHNTPQDCWTIVNGVVYNITDYVSNGQHPGGKIVQSMCGVDATKIYNSLHVHSQNADNILEQYRIR